MSILDDPDAVAALGTWRALEDAPDADLSADPDWAQDIRGAVARGTVGLSVDLSALRDTNLEAQEITALRQVWQSAAADFELGQPNHRLRLQVIPGDSTQAPTIANLLAKADGVDSVTIADRSLAGPARWDLPLNIGAVGAGARIAVDAYPHPQLIEFDFTDVARREFDLLILESLDDVAAIQNQHFAAGFLLVLTDTPASISVETVRRLNEVIGFRAAAIIPKQDNLQDLIRIFLDNLSHNQPPDVAITNAIYHDTPVIIVGDPAFLDRARFSAVTASLADEVERQFHVGALAVEEFTAMDEEIAAAPSARADAWRSEEGAATETLHRVGPVRAAMRSADARRATPMEPSPRFLQAQVFENSGAAPVQRTRSFEASAAHEIHIRVGPSSMNWITVPRSFPDFELPPEGARLTVHLLAPSFITAPEAQEILIGPTGSSTVAKFAGLAAADATQIDATVIVYHNGKHLQTAVLSGPVTQGEDAPEATGIDFSRGLPSEADLGRQQAFDLTVWKNGAELKLTLFDPAAAPGTPSNKILHPTLAGIDAVVNGIRNELFAAAGRISQLETGLEAAGLPTLRSLAEQGEYLRRTLFGAAPPAHIRRVQLVSPQSSDFFPVEFLYDYVLPNANATLCPEFKHSPGPDCTPQCHAAAGDSAYVCPSGFWALNRIIERQVRPLDRADSRQPEAAAGRPRRLELGGIIFAASNEVNTPEHPNELADTIADMQAAAPVYPASTWDEWSNYVKQHYPSLLVALPHNVESTPFHKLQIGANEELALNRIRPEYVAPADADVGPVVLLLGCNTANATIAYQDFVNEIRCAGAALVIGTLTYVLGPEAAKVAREFVEQIWKSADSATVGEIMRQVRGRMLTQDNLMALAITAFGDADWRFQTGGH